MIKRGHCGGGDAPELNTAVAELGFPELLWDTATWVEGVSGSVSVLRQEQYTACAAQKLPQVRGGISHAMLQS